MKTYLTVYSGAVLLAMVLVPIVSRLAKWRRLLDDPGPRKVHKEPVPRVGGIAFVVSTIAFVLPVFFLENSIGQSMRASRNELTALLIGAVLVFLTGLIDDVHRLSGSVKLLCILVASLAVCASGAVVNRISIGGLVLIKTGWAAWPLTVLWITVITVCIAVIDGLDGLAAGVAAMVCGILAVLAVWSGQPAMTVLMIALLGSITGFLFFNFYPAKIFMGDCGSMFLGFMIGAGSVVCNTKTSTMMGLAIPFLALGAPILDTAFLMVCRRLVERRSMFSPDRSHLHHRLLDLGLNHRAAVLVVYCITAFFAAIGLLMLATEGQWTTELLFASLLVLFSLGACLHSGRFGKILNRLKRNWALVRQARAEKRGFDHAQLMMGRAESFDEWWEAVCDMAGKMSFRALELRKRENGSYLAIRSHNLPSGKLGRTSSVRVSLPFGHDWQPEWEIRASIEVNGSLEQCGRQTMLFGRLIDEFMPPKEQQEAQTPDRPPNATFASKTTEET